MTDAKNNEPALALASVVSIEAARTWRGAALLRDEEIPDQDEAARCWNDRPRGAA